MNLACRKRHANSNPKNTTANPRPTYAIFGEYKADGTNTKHMAKALSSQLIFDKCNLDYGIFACIRKLDF